jgi:O-acetyl-ADP-ribose deacetylase (regulator of RNase III)
MQFVQGNLLESHAEALVNTVNTVGVMGKGIALQFKEAFRHNFKIYQQACKNGDLTVGKLLVVRDTNLLGEKIIVNFPTKTDWKYKSKIEYIEKGLQELRKVIIEYDIKSIALPPLGCGNGGLEWQAVKPLIINYLGDLQGVDIIVYEFYETVKK